MVALPKVLILLCGIFGIAGYASPQSLHYPWLEAYHPSEAIINRIPVPDGYERVPVVPGSFEDWLRHLPLKEGKPPVYLFDGRLKGNQTAHFAVIDMDVGNRNLQQCADAVIRLRAEYFYSVGKYDSIHFNFTSGHSAKFLRWIKGYRPVIGGPDRNIVRWIRSARVDSSYSSFRAYLDSVFMYAGTYSLSRELHRIDVMEMRIGDVFIQGGFPRHAVLVVDMAINEETGRRLFLLAQSYMPAQDVHILKNQNDPSLSPWYELDFGEMLLTPEWVFSRDDLRRL